MSSPAHTRAVGLALVALTLVAFATRWIGLGALLPQAREADTVIVHVAAAADRPEGVPLSDAAYPSTSYPFLFSGILIALPGSNYPVAAPADAPLEEHLAAAAEPYLRARRLIALLSLLAVPATFFLARRWLEPGWALLATALLVTSDLALGMSQQARPHGGLLGTSTLALLCIVALVRSATWRAYLAAGVTTAISLASLHSGFFVVPSLFAAHLLGWRRDRSRGRWGKLGVALAACALAFVLAYPFLVFGDGLQRKDAATLNLGQHAILWETWNGAGFARMLPGLFARDPVIVVAALVGAFVLFVVGVRAAVRRNDVSAASGADDTSRAEFVVLALHVVVLVGLFGLQAQFYTRFLLPVVPAACILGAYGTRGVVRWTSDRAGFSSVPWMRGALAAGAAVALLVVPAQGVVHRAIVRARPDTLTLAARWLEANVPKDSGTIGVDFSLDLPVRQSRPGLEERIHWSWRPWQRYQAEILAPDAPWPSFDVRQLFDMDMMKERRIRADAVVRRIEEINARWAVVTLPPPEVGDRDETRVGVRRVAGEPVVVIRPDRVDEREPDAVYAREEDGASSSGRVVERTGPVVEIYRLPR